MDALQRVELNGLGGDHIEAGETLPGWRPYAKLTQEPPTVAEPPESKSQPGPQNRQWDRQSNTYAKFEIKPETGEVLLKIIDGETGEVVRTVPADEFQHSVQEGQAWSRRWRVYV